MNRPTTAMTRSSPKPRIYSARRLAGEISLGSDGCICPRPGPRGIARGGRCGVGRLAADEPAVHNPPLTAAAWVTAADRSPSWPRGGRCLPRPGRRRSCGPLSLAYRRRIETTTIMQIWYIPFAVQAGGQEQVMDVEQLESFLRVAERGSLTLAAPELGITQPGLSRQMQKLERTLGVPLFARTRNGVRLTAAGERY